MQLRKALAVTALSLAAFVITPSAFSQISTPENSYPPTPAERAATADLNRQAHQGNWKSDRDRAYPGDWDRYDRDMHAYHEQVRAYHRAEHRYWREMRSMRESDQEWRRRRPYPVSYQAAREHDIDAGIVGQQIQILTGDYVGKVVGVDRDTARDIRGVYVQLERGKVVWIDVGDVRYDSPYGVIYTDLDRAALYHMPDERA
jgi:hypothetical protein